jgi:hypothetical protein
MSDSPKMLRIDVTQDHIERGVRDDGSACAVALAFMAKGFTNVEVDHEHAWMGFGGSVRQEYMIPKEVGDFIRHFDEGEEVLPITFDAKLIYEEPLHEEDPDEDYE